MKESKFQHNKCPESVIGHTVISSVMPEKTVACGYDETTNDREEEVKQAITSYSLNKNQNTTKKINPKNDKTTHGK